MAKDKKRPEDKNEVYDAGDIGEASGYKLRKFVQEPYIDYATGEIVDESVVKHRPLHELGDIEKWEANAQSLVDIFVKYLDKHIKIEDYIDHFERDASFRFALARAFERAGYKVSLDREYSPVSEKWGPHLPIKAPKLWSNRDKKTENNPASFIKEVYAEWMPYLARQDLLRFDKPLYVSYAQWVRPERHPEDQIDFDAGYGSARIKDPSEAIERRRASVRAANARMRERQKTGQNVAQHAKTISPSCKPPSIE